METPCIFFLNLSTMQEIKCLVLQISILVKSDSFIQNIYRFFVKYFFSTHLSETHFVNTLYNSNFFSLCKLLNQFLIICNFVKNKLIKFVLQNLYSTNYFYCSFQILRYCQYVQRHPSNSGSRQHCLHNTIQHTGNKHFFGNELEL